MKHHSLLGTGVVALAIALALPSAATAQDATGADQTANAQQPSSESQGLADIVVTAQRRSENLQRAAVAVSAISGEELVKADVTDTQALNRLVPALVVYPTGLSSSFFIRGVGSPSLNSFQENAVAFSVGGVFYARPTAPCGSFYDLERIEVVKGPQGTLYGRNATAGAINVVPVAPKLDTVAGTASVEYGNYNTVKAFAALNVPIGDQLALRVAGQYVDHDGYLSDGYDDDHAYAFRGQLLFKPRDGFSMLFESDYFHQGGKGPGVVLVPSPQTPNAPDPSLRIGASDPSITAILQARTLALYSNVPPFSLFPTATIRNLVANSASDGFNRSDFYGVSLTTNADVGFADLTSILGYRRSKPNILTYTPGFPGRLIESDGQMTGEIRLASKPGGPFSYVVGAFLFDEKQDAYNQFSQGLLATTTYRPRLHTDSEAVFGQLTYSILQGLRLVGGARYTFEHKSLAGDTNNVSLFVPVAPFVPISGSLSYNKATWKAGVEYDAGPQSLVYANVATGFKAGGFYPSVGANTYRPETLTAYTVGSKNRFLDNKLQVNIETFYWAYRDQQLTYVGPIESTPGNFAQAGVTVNAGKARMYGADLDVLFKPTPRDTFGVDLQYLNGKYQSLVYNAISSSGAPLLTNCAVANDPRTARAAPPIKLFIVDCSGKPALNSPRWSTNLSYQHVFDLSPSYDLTFSVRSRLETSSWVNFDYLPWQERKAYTTTDLLLTLGNKPGKWTLSAFVNNVENATVFQGGLTRPIINVTTYNLRPPRTFGVRAGINF